MRNLGSISPISSEILARCGDPFVYPALEGRDEKSWKYTNKASHVRDPASVRWKNHQGRLSTSALGFSICMHILTHACTHIHENAYVCMCITHMYTNMGGNLKK